MDGGVLQKGEGFAVLLHSRVTLCEINATATVCKGESGINSGCQIGVVVNDVNGPHLSETLQNRIQELDDGGVETFVDEIGVDPA